MDTAVARRAFDSALSEHEQVFERFFLARLLGLEISYGAETCVVEFEVKDFMFNPQGGLHGGIIATALDISMGHLIKHTIGHGGATLDLGLQYMRRVSAGRMRCEARYLRQGRGISFLESRMVDGEGKLCAMAKATFQVRAPDNKPPG